jgi:hypothetical protein
VDRNALNEPKNKFFIFQRRRNLPPALLAMSSPSLEPHHRPESLSSKTFLQFRKQVIVVWCNVWTATHSPGTAPWWNKKYSGLRAKSRKLFNKAKRTGQWDTYKETLTCYNKEIRKVKRSSWRRYCKEINDVPGRAGLMGIMAKQATNRVGTVTIPDGQHTQTGKQTLKELFRVHFRDSKLIDESYDEHGQPNLGICGRIMNRADWNLAKRVINQ